MPSCSSLRKVGSTIFIMPVSSSCSQWDKRMSITLQCCTLLHGCYDIGYQRLLLSKPQSNARHPIGVHEFDAIFQLIAQPLNYLILAMQDDLSDVPVLARLSEPNVELLTLHMSPCKFNHFLFETYLGPASQKNLCFLHLELLMSTAHDFFLVLYFLSGLTVLNRNRRARRGRGVRILLSDIRKISPRRIETFRALLQLKDEMEAVASESNIFFDFLNCTVFWANRPHQIEDLVDTIARHHSKIERLVYAERNMLLIPAVVPHMPPMSHFCTILAIYQHSQICLTF